MMKMKRMQARRMLGILLALCLMLVLAPAAGAQGTGTVEGTVVNGNTGQPVGGLTVTLDRYEGVTASESLTAQVDAQGRFRFEGLPVGDKVIYLANVTYAGVEYPSGMITLTVAQASQTIELAVYDATDDGSGISIERAHIIVQPSAAGIAVAEVIVISNSGTGAYAGKAGASGMPYTLRFYLPAGAGQLNFEDGGLGTRFIQVGDSFVDVKPVRPGVGVEQIVFSYVLPAQSGAWSMDYRLGYAAKTLNVLTSEGWEVTGGGLTFVGKMGGSATQAPFLNYQVKDVPADQPLALSFAPGTPAGAQSATSGASVPSPASAQPALLLVMAGVSVLLLAGVLMYPLWREALPRGQGQ